MCAVCGLYPRAGDLFECSMLAVVQYIYANIGGRGARKNVPHSFTYRILSTVHDHLFLVCACTTAFFNLFFLTPLLPEVCASAEYYNDTLFHSRLQILAFPIFSTRTAIFRLTVVVRCMHLQKSSMAGPIMDPR